MRKFRNRRLASVLVAFLLVFVLAGAFAATQWYLDINARVNMFSPAIDIVWLEVEITDTPPLWDALNDPDTALTGIGIPAGAGGNAMFNARMVGWPQPVIDQLNWPTNAGGSIPARGVVVETLYAATGNVIAQGFPIAWAYTGATMAATRVPGEFPDDTEVEEMTLAESEHYILLNIGMVFDNVDQRYTFEVTAANPSPVPVHISSIEVYTAAVFDPLNTTGGTPAQNIVWNLGNSPFGNVVRLNGLPLGSDAEILAAFSDAFGLNAAGTAPLSPGDAINLRGTGNPWNETVELTFSVDLYDWIDYFSNISTRDAAAVFAGEHLHSNLGVQFTIRAYGTPGSYS